jgi:hypothetical protein
MPESSPVSSRYLPFAQQQNSLGAPTLNLLPLAVLLAIFFVVAVPVKIALTQPVPVSGSESLVVVGYNVQQG